MGSHTPTPLKVKLGVEDLTNNGSYMPYFTFISATNYSCGIKYPEINL